MHNSGLVVDEAWCGHPREREERTWPAKNTLGELADQLLSGRRRGGRPRRRRSARHAADQAAAAASRTRRRSRSTRSRTTTQTGPTGRGTGWSSASIPARISTRRTTGSPARTIRTAPPTPSGAEPRRPGQCHRLQQGNRRRRGFPAHRRRREGLGEKHGAINKGEWVVMRTGWYQRNRSEAEFLNARDNMPHSPGPTVDCIEYLIGKGIVGWGTETVGTDAGKAGTFEPPFPAHNLLHKNNRYGLASLANLDKLPPKGAILIAAPLKFVQRHRQPDPRAGAGAETLGGPWPPPTTSSSAAASTGSPARRCSAGRAAGARAGARERRRRLHAHRSHHRARLSPRRDGDDLRALHHLAGLRQLGADLAQHGLEFCHIAQPTGVLLPDGRSLVLSTDRAANVARFNALAAGDGDRYRADVGAVERDAALLFGLLGGALWTRATAKLLAPRSLAARSARPCGAAWRRAALRPRRGLRRATKSELVRALFAPWVLHAGLGPENAFSGEIARVIAFALEAAGAPIVKGGAKNAVAAFEALDRGAGRRGAHRRRRCRDRRLRRAARAACGSRTARRSRPRAA